MRFTTRRKPRVSLGSFLMVGIVIAIATCGYVYGTEGETDITVKRFGSKLNGGTEKYLIWTENNDVFENTDSLLRGKFDSSSLQGEFEEGGRYTVKYYGMRIPFFSLYKNIYEITPISE